ncbi:alpha-amylase family glycosyl hydrolase [Collinsella aerofaciens]|nr:alpha-amylase family glycosyl hydrolase [Collinsella aerofaciens]MDB1903492.1 alpha-amylase family glycosyl hydrolase [Collinsella aerofaciens]
MKIAQWADCLQKLGVGAVLINPPLESDSHGYDTRSLRHIDRRLGGDADFAAVCDTLHAHGIRVVLDAVFNHVGRGFWAFRDVQERKWDSPYKDWFHISFDGDSCYGDGFWYEGWEGHFELVKLNLQNPAVVDYLLESVRRWADVFGVDGLRLDVAYMLDRDFMRRLHSFTRELKPGFVLIGETLHGDYNQIVNDEMLDSCTNYECYKGLYSSFNSVNMFEIAHSLHRQFGGDPWCIYRGKHLLSFVDNHDVPRLASILTDKSCLRPAYGMLFGMPGIPCVYYGSEWGIPGEKGGPDGDWALRPALDEPAPNELTAFITQLAHLRSADDAAARALNYGAYRNVVIQNKQLLFERACDDAAVLVAVNAVGEPYTFGAGELNGSFVDLLADDAPTVELTGTLELAPYEVRYLLRA